MRRAYMLIDNKTNQFVSKGNSARMSWRSPYWIAYHLLRYRWNPKPEDNPLEGYSIMTVTSDGKTSIHSAESVLSKYPIYTDYENRVVTIHMGFPCTIKTLVKMVETNSLSAEAHAKAIELFKSRNINQI